MSVITSAALLDRVSETLKARENGAKPYLGRRALVLLEKIAGETAASLTVLLQQTVLIKDLSLDNGAVIREGSWLKFAIYGDPLFVALEPPLPELMFRKTGSGEIGQDPKCPRQYVRELTELCSRLVEHNRCCGSQFVGPASAETVEQWSRHSLMISASISIGPCMGRAEIVASKSVVQRLAAYSKLLIDSWSMHVLGLIEVKTGLRAACLSVNLAALLEQKRSFGPPCPLSAPEIGWEVQARTGNFTPALIKLRSNAGINGDFLQLKAF